MILNKYNMLYAIVSNLKNLIKSFPLYKNSRYKIRFECEIYVYRVVWCINWCRVVLKIKIEFFAVGIFFLSKNLWLDWAPLSESVEIIKKMDELEFW